ncbi:sensor histidine kinase [Actinomadura rugatobispora]|uniref:histidine kinase n=1 Tax=Actinomadura rugatobispora TaxID=1994 RepID=A0ABW0ZQU0_9ACTN|nr:hypothetical protein GCM10010200_096560 [Actinomadura rugatobispora]
MASSAVERPTPAAGPLPERVGAAFGMLMRIRMLVAALTLPLLPSGELNLATFLLVLSIVALSWLAGRGWRLIAPRVATHPLYFALDMVISFGILGIGGVSGPFFICTVVTAAVAGLLYRWQGMLAVAIQQVAFYCIVYGVSLRAPDDIVFQSVLAQALYYPLAGVAGVGLRRLLDDFAAKEAELRRAEVQAAAADERARLAREMHDSLAKTLRGVAMIAAALPTWISRDQARAVSEAERVAVAAEVASKEARTLLAELREDAAQRSFPDTVRDMAERWGADTATAVIFDFAEGVDLPPRSRHEARAILSEALANVERHAAARSVWIRLAWEESMVVLTVRDDGRGFRPRGLPELAREGHYGLIGLHERAERVGGRVWVASEPGAGTTVGVRLPVVEPADRRLAEAGTHG